MKATVSIQVEEGGATISCDFDDSNITQLKDQIMAAFDDLKAEIAAVRASQEATKQAVLDAVAIEGQQVAATIAALETKLADMMTPDQLEEIKGELQALQSHSEELVAQIDAIHTPAVVEEPINPDEPPPAPEPLPPIEPLVEG